MLNYEDSLERIHNLGLSFDIQQYLFVVQCSLEETPAIAYAMMFDQAEFKRILGTEQENEYLANMAKKADIMLQQQECKQLKALVDEAFRAEVQKKAINLEDFNFSTQEIVNMLSKLLADRSKSIEEASIRDIVSLIRELNAQGGLSGGDGGFERHFINIFPPFTAMCSQCNREIDLARGVSGVCPFCGTKYTWVEEENRFYPQPTKL